MDVWYDHAFGLVSLSINDIFHFRCLCIRQVGIGVKRVRNGSGSW